MTEGRLLRHSASTPWRRVGSEIVLAPAGRDDFEVLQGTGAVVWELLEDPSTEAELLSALAEIYSIAEVQIATDVGALLATLVDMGAVEQTEGQDAGRR